MPFGQMMSGDGYGVKPTYEFIGIEVAKDAKTTKKFVEIGAVSSYKPNCVYKLGALVKLADGIEETKLSIPSIYVSVTSATKDGNVSATYELIKDNWKESFITFAEGSYGIAKIVITDYYYCEQTVIYLDLEVPGTGTQGPGVDFGDEGTWD